MLSVKSIQSERERWADGQRYKSFDKNSLQRKHVIAEVVVVIANFRRENGQNSERKWFNPGWRGGWSPLLGDELNSKLGLTFCFYFSQSKWV